MKQGVPPDSAEEALAKLTAKIDELKPAPQSESANHRAEGQALRIVSDFSAATLVGAGLGYGVDYLFHCAPWGLVAGLFLGCAAGARRMLQVENNALTPPKKQQ